MNLFHCVCIINNGSLIPVPAMQPPNHYWGRNIGLGLSNLMFQQRNGAKGDQIQPRVPKSFLEGLSSGRDPKFPKTKKSIYSSSKRPQVHHSAYNYRILPVIMSSMAMGEVKMHPKVLQVSSSFYKNPLSNETRLTKTPLNMVPII